MQDQSPILSLPLIQPSQAQKHVTHNEALRVLDALVQLAVQDRDRTEPPGDPAPGARHIVAPGATGAWVGADRQVGIWDGVSWSFLDPLPGWRAEVISEGRLVVFDGVDWVVRLPQLDNLPRLGINTAADPVNRFSASAQATLFNHEGASHQLKVNKATPGDTASLLFQTGFSGRAEMGTAGRDDWSIKVSPDGTGWTEALRVAAASGLVSGAAVQSNAGDTTAGRLMTVGAFGLGSESPSEITDFTAALRPGFYRYGESTATGAPGDGSVFECTAIVSRGAGGRTFAFAMRQTQNPVNQRMFFGSRSSETGPFEWRTVWHDAYDGIEFGSNATGSYMRFPNGVQWCWHRLDMGSITNGGAGTLADPYKTAGQHWTFPASFSTSFLPEVFATVEYKGALIDARRVVNVAKGARNATTVYNLQLWRWADFSEPDEYFLSLMAVGRWF